MATRLEVAWETRQTQRSLPSQEVIVCFMLVLALRLRWGWAHRWVRDAGLRIYRESAISLLLEQFLQPLPSLGCGTEVFSWFFPQRISLRTQPRLQIPGHETILYLDYSGIGDLHWSSFSSRCLALITLPNGPENLTIWAAIPALLPTSIATPSKSSNPWKLPFPHLQNRSNSGSSLNELIEGLNKIKALSLAHNNFSTHSYIQ